MIRKIHFNTLLHQTVISWFDIVILSLLIIGGFFYLHDVMFWSVGLIGNAPYGDAGFWWDGALHIAHGFFLDNPGKGYRPGYFLLTGLTLPVLGEQFQQFYYYFLFTFLMTAAFFYLALRKTLGQLAAICVTGMLIFNPYTAEWVTTSTTDSTGLLLDLAALSCLLFGIHQNWSRPWLIAFGLLFALANLTRPLMTPFIGVVLLVLLFLPNIPRKTKITLALSILFAFCLPTLVWMGVQKLIVNEWSISQNGASALYAASDPHIQVWRPDMYEHINQLALKRYHQGDLAFINKIFWQETIANYFRNPLYHLSRLLPHTWVIGQFSPAAAKQGTDSWQRIFLAILAIGMGLFCLQRKKIIRSFIFFSITCILYFSSVAIPYLTLLGALLALQTKRLDILLLSCYWLTGVAALYLTGGTWGPPLAPVFSLNALGYRLGTQVFFMGDLLAAFSLVWLAYFKQQEIKLVNRPSLLAGKIVINYFIIFWITVFFIYCIGTGMVFYRAYEHLHANAKPYPSLTNVINTYQQQNNGHAVIIGKSMQGGLDSATLNAMSVKINSPDVILTGRVSPFIWNFTGQDRAELMIYAQQNIYPNRMGPQSLMLELPYKLNEKKWMGKKGAFIIRSIANQHNTSNLPYYLTNPTIRAFVPLTRDGQQFDLTKIQWFPMVKNATQLETSGELQFHDATITWSNDSGSYLFKRRFLVSTSPLSPHSIQLTLNIKAAKGLSSQLNFSYALDNLNISTYKMKISTISQINKKLNILSSEMITSSSNEALHLKTISLVLPPNTEVVNIDFNDLPTNSSIWFYEFNLSAMDFIS